MCALLAGCGTPRVIEEHHHHHYEADTAAVQKQIDSQLSQWHSEMQQFFIDKLEHLTELSYEELQDIERKARRLK
jgi:phenylalanine-4-hydroxylase